MCFLIELQDVAAEIMDSPPSKTSPLKGGKDVEGGLFESSSEDGYSESSEEGSPRVTTILFLMHACHRMFTKY
jgi:hypothetical protein